MAFPQKFLLLLVLMIKRDLLPKKHTRRNKQQNPVHTKPQRSEKNNRTTNEAEYDLLKYGIIFKGITGSHAIHAKRKINPPSKRFVSTNQFNSIPKQFKFLRLQKSLGTDRCQIKMGRLNKRLKHMFLRNTCFAFAEGKIPYKIFAFFIHQKKKNK